MVLVKRYICDGIKFETLCDAQEHSYQKCLKNVSEQSEVIIKADDRSYGVYCKSKKKFVITYKVEIQ